MSDERDEAAGGLTDDWTKERGLLCKLAFGRDCGGHVSMCSPSFHLAVDNLYALRQRRRAERERPVLLHLIQRNHGYRPEACSACEDADRLLRDTDIEPGKEASE